jgi:hypothetical protein
MTSRDHPWLLYSTLAISLVISFFVANFGYLFVHSDGFLLFLLAPFLLIAPEPWSLAFMAYLAFQAVYHCIVVYAARAGFRWLSVTKGNSDA